MLGETQITPEPCRRSTTSGTNRYEAVPEKFGASLLSTTAFSFGADVIADYEYAGIGANWVNWREGDYSLYTSMSFMLVSLTPSLNPILSLNLTPALS